MQYKQADKAVIDDVLRLCDEALKKRGSFFHIASEQGSIRLGQHTYLIDYVYHQPETPFFLERNGLATLLTYDQKDELPTLRNPIPKGYYALQIDDFEKMTKWRDEEMDNRIGNNKAVIFPVGGHYTYENEVFYIKRRDGSPCPLDLSGMQVLRPIFEAFFYLFRDTNKTTFTISEVLVSYKRIAKNEIDRHLLSKRKASIMKTINNKPCLKNRIVWKYDRTGDKWIFDILPSSDK